MKRAFSLVAVGLMAAAGCFPESFLNHNADKPAAPQASQPLGAPRTFVRPEQVDERNCHEKEKLLRRELEMDEQNAVKTPAADAKR